MRCRQPQAGPLRSQAVPLVAPGQYLVGGDLNALPACATLAELLYSLSSLGSVLCAGRDQMGDSLSMASDGNGLAVFHVPQELCEACPCFSRLYLAHRDFQPVILTR